MISFLYLGMFNGLKKIVGGKSEEPQNSNVVATTPDLLITPSISRSIKKRKGDLNGFSTKKKFVVLLSFKYVF